MTRANGIVSEADKLYNCSYFEYYWRIVGHNEFVKRQNEALEKSKTKNRK